MREKLSRAEWCALGFGVLVAHGFLVHEWLYPSSYDSLLYQHIASELAEHGPFYRFTAAEMRTYGYPFFLSFVQRAASALGLPLPVVVFELQLLLYLGATFFLRAALMRVQPLAGRIVFCGILANFYVLIYTPETLTESVSITLLVFAAGCWLELYRRHSNPWPLIAGSLAVGYAMMVRPGSMFMVVTWIVGLILIALRKRPGIARASWSTACVVIALSLPMVPQLANNIAFFHKRTPLVYEDLGKMQQIWGIQNIKYATGMPPVPRGAIYYLNPLWVGTVVDEKSPLRWYVDYPVRGLLTLGIHTFNLTDQDLLFTYSRDLDPWYRVPLGVVNHAAVALGLVGLVLLGRRVLAGRQPQAIDGYVMLLLLLGSNLAMYAWTAVEMRFGAVLLLLLFPLAGYAAMRIWSERSVRTGAAVGLGVGAYVALAFVLSNWVGEQAPLIRDARAAAADKAVP
jgi:hypothetical protein